MEKEQHEEMVINPRDSFGRIMLTPDYISCEDCRFWEWPDRKEIPGECRRKSPEIGLKYPETKFSFWCGEFMPRFGYSMYDMDYEGSDGMRHEGQEIKSFR